MNRASLHDDAREPVVPASSREPEYAVPDAAGSVTCLVAELIRGDHLGARMLWQPFFPRL